MIMGIGPINITAPPLNGPFDPEPTVSSKIPIRIIAKAIKNSQLEMDNTSGILGCIVCTVACPVHLEQDQWDGWKQPEQTLRPHDWHT